MYIGRTPQIGAYSKLDAITTDGSASYTMQLDSANFVPESVNHLIVSVNGVIQAPTDSFTVSGSTITFASSLSVSDTIDFIMALGNVLDIGVPSDATVSLSKLTATGTKDATTFLRGDNTFAEVPAGGITNAQLFRVNSSFTGGGVITSNWEEADTDGSGSIGSNVSQSSGIFSFSTTGIYLIYFQLALYENVDQRLLQMQIQSSTDSGSTYDESATGYTFLKQQSDVVFSTAQTQFMFDVDNIGTRKIRFYTGVGSGTTNIGDTNANKTFASFIRLGDT
jgi:hypothetical protein